MPDAFDPNEVEDRKRSSHISRRDIIWVAVVLVILAILLYPWVQNQILQRDSQLCTTNLKALSEGLQLYAIANNDRLPPTHRTQRGSHLPELENGSLVTWITTIESYVELDRNAFRCPSAQEGELVSNDHPSSDGAILSAYGMYGAWSAKPLGDVAHPATAIVIADSSNLGARGTYDPMPFKSPDGELLPDGFLIGLDTTNFDPDNTFLTTLNAAEAATRLAFPGTSKGNFQEKGQTRHPSGVQVLFLDGHTASIRQPAARLNRAGAKGEITGFWSLR